MPLYELTVGGRLLFVTADTDAGATTMARETVRDAYVDAEDPGVLDGRVLLTPEGGGKSLVDETLRETLRGND